ncbi:hypothetical protein O6H91_18G071100 [Diphasiastrum complanatum]|uniref:Uncharacterized protein n=5 Tax=Diphasiastrum complanatum TaxID=34168 RepID=A0ACC2B3P0_DIPCM|nr:hypothetical protein O6H91_18G071100 [Diphasiastrum complanatum]KAJ7523972.1 hypothetical protein O6H91_18G071100 [Diphasiastrum complanatum]KAJ7523973.1 hypothetical protein O6H91_18G071100 [Diphasiastrum complanatum]KAJ7523974.1 hypothetical protein O6H91_18G071100 [Diphasiastrum complanatum]KAJ7523975.1 hypothetical protein O6H91_18G071100 [Diphasiastrum complanatum]
MSFRRVLSVHERGLQNGTPFVLSSSPIHGLSPMAPQRSNSFAASVTSSPQSEGISRFSFFLVSAILPFSWLKVSQRQATTERSKPKGYVSKKPFLHMLACFLLGFGIGLTPFRQYDFLRSTSSALGVRLEGREDFAIEWRDFATSLQLKANRFTGTEQGSVTKEAQNLGSPRNHLVRSDTADESLRSKLMVTPTTNGNQVHKKLLIVITPTYPRPFQALYLTRLAHTLKLVPAPLLWLVVETPVQSLETAALLRNTGVMYRHLVCTKNLSNLKDRGIHQRNAALDHIERHQLDGIVYFADDDNVYTLELFEQLREIKRFGTWPVGMLAHSKSKTILEGPVCKGNTVIGWHTNEKSKRLRRFHVDMSGFGFNSSLLWDPRTWHRPVLEPIRQLDTIKEGFQETTFIEQLVEDENQMEGRPDGCSKVMVWHLHLEAQGSTSYPSGWNLEKELVPTF